MSDLSRTGDLEVKVVGTDGVTSAEVTSGNKLQVDAEISNNLTHPYKGAFFSTHLKNAGSQNMNVDGSSTPVDFTLGPGSGKKWYIARMLIYIEDTAMNFNKFGGVTALTNGILLKITESGSERNLSEYAIKSNGDFMGLCYDATIKSATTDVLSIRWTFAKTGTFLKFLNSTSDQIKATVQDDLTGLQEFRILIQGYEVNE